MRKSMSCILAILSAMLLTGCASTNVITVDKVIVPEIVFPIFPLADKMSVNEDGTVSVTGDWLIRLEEYHIRIQETEDNYNGLKEIYEKFYGENNEKFN